MAKMYPPTISADTKSDAERKFYEACRTQLDDNYHVIHSVRWIALKPVAYKSQGEADFIIAHPDYGILVLEVKGGDVRLENKEWFTIDRYNQRFVIKDPFVQADRNKFALLEHLKNGAKTSTYTYPVYHAVVFPDILLKNISLPPHVPHDITIDRDRLADLPNTLRKIFVYWRERFPTQPPNRAGIEAFLDLIVPKREIRTRLSHLFEDEDKQIKQLTEQQYDVLLGLQRSRRMAIIGGAGTGKTMLALEKARQLASSGFKVLVLCYNTNLANWLTEVTKGMPNVFVSTFHGIARKVAGWANYHVANLQDYLDKPEDILYSALDNLHSSNDYLFDAVIIDEAQDFKPDYWIPVDSLLKDKTSGVLYIFFDENQTLYQLSNIPIPKGQEPFVLTRNLRNTRPIFELVRQYQTDIQYEGRGPQGRPVQFKSVETDEQAKQALLETLNTLINEEKVHPNEIVVITPRAENISQWKQDLSLGKYRFTWDLTKRASPYIRVCTIHSFKGLESPIVILTELNHVHADKRDQLLYVALSRARNLLIVLGNLPNINDI